jgi:hypothetical protein
MGMMDITRMDTIMAAIIMAVTIILIIMTKNIMTTMTITMTTTMSIMKGAKSTMAALGAQAAGVAAAIIIE